MSRWKPVAAARSNTSRWFTRSNGWCDDTRIDPARRRRDLEGPALAVVGGADRFGLADRPRSIGAGRAERLEQHDQAGAVVHEDLEPDLVDEGGDTREHVVRAQRRVAGGLHVRVAAPSRAASSMASQMSAIASGAFSRRPRSRRRRASSAALKMRSRSSSQPVRRTSTS